MNILCSCTITLHVCSEIRGSGVLDETNDLHDGAVSSYKQDVFNVVALLHFPSMLAPLNPTGLLTPGVQSVSVRRILTF